MRHYGVMDQFFAGYGAGAVLRSGRCLHCRVAAGIPAAFYIAGRVQKKRLFLRINFLDRNPADKKASWPVSRVLCRRACRRDGHSSGTPVAKRLEQPTRTAMRKRIPGCGDDRSPMPPLFGFAPGGVCPAASVTSRAVRSYRTLSPLLSAWGLPRFAHLEAI